MRLQSLQLMVKYILWQFALPKNSVCTVYRELRRFTELAR